MPRRRSVTRTVRAIHAALEDVATAFGRLEPLLAAAAATANGGSITPSGKRPRKRNVTLSPARHRALVLHGRYLGSIRGLKPRQRAQIKKVRAAKGVRAAIAAARRIAE